MSSKFTNPAYSRSGIAQNSTAQNGTAQVGTPGNDVLRGNPNGSNVLVGNGGSDRIIGGIGNDVLIGGNQSSFTLPTTPTPSTSTPTATPAPVPLPIAINGTPNNDVLHGTDQSETIAGGKGVDTLFGGGGNDTFVWNPGDGSDRISSGAGTDTSVTNLGGEGEISMLRSMNNTVVFDRLTQAPFRMTHDGTENIQINAMDGNDILIADKLAATGTTALSFVGAGGNDVLFGGTSDVAITATGGDGDDILIGGLHSNTLSGSEGNDFLVGNQGVDHFVFGSGKPFSSTDLGVDRIATFNPAQDKIDLSKATFASISAHPGQALRASDFAHVDSDEAAALSVAKITYVQPTGSSSGKLFYNANGAEAGLGNGAQFAVFAGAPLLTDQNFALVA